MRINKYLTHHGVCSRRQADVLIERGKVMLEGRVAVLGDQVPEGAVVTVNGIPVETRKKPIYIKLYKPPGIVCTSDRNEPDNIIDYVQHPERIFPIGRLDKFSSGLILLTNDGDIVNKILRSQYGNEKEYLVKIDQPFDQRFVSSMAQGVEILGRMTLPCTVRRLGSRAIQIILKQGRNRQIRRMVETLGYRVTDLKRTRVMHIGLDDMVMGEWRELDADELQLLLERVNSLPADEPSSSASDWDAEE